MRKVTGFAIALLTIFSTTQETFSQCADEGNVTSFTYNGTTYEVVQENQTWVNAAACAVERGGYLIEINDANEQAAIAGNLPPITFTNTTAPDGGGAGYLWIGGNDIGTEGEWVWDGNNDSNGTQFWNGDANGTPVGGLYNNWGNEPDDFGSGQDALAYAITNWPLGNQEQWNDVDKDNTLYYIIEFPTASINESNSLKQDPIYPNPANESIQISSDNASSFTITNSAGTLVKAKTNLLQNSISVDISEYTPGIYFVHFTQKDNEVITEKFIKK